jgi:hypothetical protein
VRPEYGMKIVKYYAISEIEDSYQLHRTMKTKTNWNSSTTFIVFLQRKQQATTCYTLKSNNVQHSQTLILYNQ